MNVVVSFEGQEISEWIISMPRPKSYIYKKRYLKIWSGRSIKEGLYLLGRLIEKCIVKRRGSTYRFYKFRKCLR